MWPSKCLLGGQGSNSGPLRESVVLSSCQRGDMSVNTIISWRGRDGATGYERAGPGDSHLLTLDYSETGPVEIAVTFSFSSSVCNKTTITQYNGKIVAL